MLAGVVAAALLAGFVAPAGASTPSTPYVPTRIDAPDSPPLRWGERLVAASLPGPLGGNPVTPGDLDDDGVNDFWTAAPFMAVNGNPSQGRVYAVSGRTFAVIYRIDAPVVMPADAAAFGFFISTPGDVNFDDKPDIVVGTDAQNVAVKPALGGCVSPPAPEPNGCNENQGAAWVFSGATGALLYDLENPLPQGSASPNNSARFGSRIGRAGDINGDRVPDIIVGASNQDVCTTSLCTQLLFAAARTAGTQANAGNLACGNVTPIPPGCGQNQGQAFIFSGATGSLLRTLNLPAADQVPTANTACTANCGNFGLAVQSPGDLNRDGIDDQYVDASNLTVNGRVGQGRVYLFSGADGSLLARVDDPVPQAGATFGFQDAAPYSPGDINGDGVPEIYTNGFAQDGALAGEGKAWIFDGQTTVATGQGQLLVTVDDPTPELGGQFGWSMTTTDYDNDGRADFYVGQSPHHVAGASGSGGSYVFNGPASAAAGTAVLFKALELPQADIQNSTANNLGPNLGWGLAAPGDLDGDGNQEYLAGAPFQDVRGVVNAGQIFAFQSKERPPVANPDGNTTTDIALFRPSTGQWLVRGGAPTVTNFGTAGDVQVAADYDGDGRSDLAVYRPSTGQWFIQVRQANGTSTTATYFWGAPGDVPVPGDYDGDGTAEPAVYRNGLWLVQGGPTIALGTTGDIPVPGDYNGDGTTEAAVYRPSSGIWFIQGQAPVAWGAPGDIPVPADYDGDGTTDIAVYRPSSGVWFVQGGPTVAWGAPGDIPAPGDYNGDGVDEIAVFRPSTGVWFVQGGPTVHFGTAGDQPWPLPAAIRQAFFP